MNLMLRSLLSLLLISSLALASVGLSSTSALAQAPAGEPAADQPSADQPSADQPLPPPPPPVLDGEQLIEDLPQEGDPAGWHLLSRAAEQLARGNKDSARRLLEQLAAQHPEHPATAVSANALAVLTRQRARRIDPNAEEEKSALARAEFAFFQTAHGIVLGTELCVMIECDSPQSGVMALGAGGGLGLGLSLLATSDGITPGHASLLNSGTTWGFMNGLLVSYAIEVDDENAAGLYAVSQLGGLGLGALIWNVAQPTSGEVAMANSGGFWAGFLAMLAHGFNDYRSSEEAVSWSVLLGADLGLIGGALLSQRFPMSRGRTFVIDSGGIVGFLIGLGTYVLVDEGFESASGFASMTMLGTIGGLGTAAYLTRDWDAPEEDFSANWTVAPTDGGAMLSVGGSF